MATRSSNIKRNFEFNEDELLNDVPCIASDIVYEGSAVGDNASGYGRPLEGGDPFLGFSVAKTDNSAGSAGDKNIRVKQRGSVEADITGVTGVGDIGSTVYMSDDDTFTLTSSSNSAIGKITRYISGTKCIVRFEAAQVRSV